MHIHMTLSNLNEFLYCKTGAKDVLKLIENSPTMNALGAQYVDLKLTACKDYVPLSRKYFRCQFEHFIGSGQHPTSTCKMGSRKNKKSVLDPHLR